MFEQALVKRPTLKRPPMQPSASPGFLKWSLGDPNIHATTQEAELWTSHFGPACMLDIEARGDVGSGEEEIAET
jgi:hypothetical protein